MTPMRPVLLLFACMLLALLAAPVFADDDTAALRAAVDSVWVITAGALVFFMQAGFALLESGLSRAKNSVNIIMKNYTDLCVGSLAFWAVGYGLMFGANATGWFGSSHFLLSEGAPFDYTFLFFQMMFAATAATITSGAMAERTRFAGYLLGAIGICALIYPVFGSWAWGSRYEGKGWLAALGFVDFAGSTVVHSVGGWCALAAVIVLGPRLGRFASDGRARTIPGHNLNYAALGGFILWLGWFGFNAGSTVAASESIGLIALNTQMAAVSGVVGVLLVSWLRRKPVLASNAINGGIAGLVAITAGCATMAPGFAVLTGLIASVVMLLGDDFLKSIQVDDVVGAVSVHGFCGAWGTLAAGMFYAGDLFDPLRMIVQFGGVLVAFLWAFPLALLMYWLIDRLVGLRASDADERRGLDYTEHHELGYPEFQANPLHARLPE